MNEEERDKLSCLQKLAFRGETTSLFGVVNFMVFPKSTTTCKEIQRFRGKTWHSPNDFPRIFPIQTLTSVDNR